MPNENRVYRLVDPFPPETAEERADELFDDVSGKLRDRPESRSTKAQLRAHLESADAAFQALHDWVMAGNPLPDPWRRFYEPRDSEADPGCV
ncbi:hypothetical protein Q8791_18010 [Nocardiopsis sp. CT-R113]|uniref:Uncharacterized protein n=1 Tax=Nocardiopsis codii TaxID=3065942 RepID=A0ABU7KAS6_9ACTN|nr:hypothetical protein [Nocardiopsis sp. CT-R113]MEE2039112.1 hypothetical protein [Nocardiopsis sp. CT-R113]